ncbi:MAG: AzlC family ABC transporter permease, partial [Anaerolineaceae bacterium]
SLKVFPSSTTEFWHGARDELPILLGVAPFGMIFGALALSTGLPAGIAQAMSMIVFAGSSQFIAVQLMGAGVPALVIFLTGVVVNLRHALYSASISPHLQHLSPSWRSGLAYLLTDEAYAITIHHYNDQTHPIEKKHWYFLGAGLTLWVCWQISTALGIFVGTILPSSIPLDFTLPLVFIALVVPSLRDKPAILAAIVSGVFSVVFFGLPYKLGMLLAAIIGMGVGLWLEKK